MLRGKSNCFWCAAWMATEAMRLASSALGHTLPISFLTIIPDTDRVHLELTLNPFELNFYSEMDRDKSGRIDALEWEEQQAEVTRLILECLVLRVGGNPVPAEVAGTTLHLDDHHVTLRAHYPVDARHLALSIESSLAALTSGSHFTQVTYGRGEQTQAARLDLFSAQATFDPNAFSGRFEAGQRGGGVSGPVMAVASLIGLVVLPGLSWGWAMGRSLEPTTFREGRLDPTRRTLKQSKFGETL